MKVNVLVYILVYSKGEERAAVCNERSDNICMVGVDEDGKCHQFESEAYHLLSWAFEHGFTMRQEKITVEA